MSEWIPLLIDIVSGSLMLVGALCVIVGGVGILRMPDLYTRMHASSLTDTMATLALFSGMMLQTGLTLATIKLFAIMVFLLLTGPTATYALANAALMAGVNPGSDPAKSKDNARAVNT